MIAGSGNGIEKRGITGYFYSGRYGRAGTTTREETIQMTQKGKTSENKAEEAAPQAEGTRIFWDHAKMKTTYANVCNVSSTREEVSILFGTNQTVNLAQNGITVELTDRIILNPYAAKRLAHILTGVIQQYEATFGALPID